MATVSAQIDGLTGKLQVDGVEMSTTIQGFTITVQPDCLPRVELDLFVMHIPDLAITEAHVVVPDETHAALVALGWTPPRWATTPTC